MGEIQNLGYEISQVDNGKVTFFGDAAAIARANIFLRTTERILLKIDSFRATSFDDLFEAVKAIPWADYIPEDGKFWVTKALQTAYDYFCDEFENMLGAAFGIAPARDGIGKTQSDAKDLLRNTSLATVNKVYLDRYLEDYQKRREKEIHRQE